MRRVFYILALLTLPSIVRAQATRATTEPTEADLRRQARAEVMGDMVHLTSLGTLAVDDLVHVALQNEWLSITTPLAQSAAPRSFKLDQCPGMGRIDFADMPRGRSGALLISFFNVDDPRSLVVHTSISVANFQVQLTHDEETLDDKTLSVQLIQNTRPGDTEQGIKLYVQDTRGADDRSHVTQYRAPTMAKFLQDHPAEADRYLRPLFSAIKLTTPLFQISPKLAWQVLGGQMTIDPATATAADGALAELGDASYERRQQAQADLLKLGLPAAIYLSRRTPDGLSIEQSSRLGAFLRDFEPASAAEVKRDQNDLSFLLDCLACEDKRIVPLALDQLKILLGRPIAFDARASLSARAEAADALRSQLIPSTKQP